MKNKNILILGYRHLGDSLFIIPAIKHLKETFLQSKIDIIVGESVEDIFINTNIFNEIIILPKNSFKEKLLIWKKLKAKRYTDAFLFQHTFLNALLLYFLKIQNRYGLNWKFCKELLTNTISYSNNWHEIERYLNIVSLATKSLGEKKLYFPLTQSALNFADTFFTENTLNNFLVIGINPGSSKKWKIKRWAKEKYIELIKTLIKNLNCKIIIFGGGEEENLIKEIYNKIKDIEKIILAQNLNLFRLATVIKKCNLLITNDTGPMHIATAVETPLIDIVGQSNIKKTGPIGENVIIIRNDLKCSPCKKQICNNRLCLDLITVDEVYKAVIQLLNKD